MLKLNKITATLLAAISVSAVASTAALADDDNWREHRHWNHHNGWSRPYYNTNYAYYGNGYYRNPVYVNRYHRRNDVNRVINRVINRF